MLRNQFLGPIVLTMLFLTASIATSCNSGNQQNTEGNTDNKTSKETAQKTGPATPVKNILFFGTSLTAGYGLDVSEAFPALIQNKIDAVPLNYRVINAGLSGETSAAGKERIDFVISDQPLAVFVLEIGANDGLRGLPIKDLVSNLQEIIDHVKAKNPDVKFVLAGMQIPPSMGIQYAADFKAVYPALAKKNNMTLVPFLLQGVGGIPKLNQEDGIHPTVDGQKILAENVWAQLKGLL